MEALFRAIDEILVAKNSEIHILKWEKEILENKIAKLEEDIEKYKENEVNRV